MAFSIVQFQAFCGTNLTILLLKINVAKLKFDWLFFLDHSNVDVSDRIAIAIIVYWTWTTGFGMKVWSLLQIKCISLYYYLFAMEILHF